MAQQWIKLGCSLASNWVIGELIWRACASSGFNTDEDVIGIGRCVSLGGCFAAHPVKVLHKTGIEPIFIHLILIAGIGGTVNSAEHKEKNVKT